MKKEKRMFIGVVALLVLAVVTCYSVSGTYARYATQVDGTDSARVALWSWKINDAALANTSTTFAMDDLFAAGKIYELTSDACTTTADTEVKQDGAALVAPGTCGKVTIKVENLSEVKAQYAYTLTETNTAGIPIKYSLTGAADSWKTVAQINADNTTAGAKDIGMGANDTISLYWKWDYGTDSTTDTGLGFTGTDTVQLKATLKLTQAD